ncbi:cupin domain-containing protein [Siccirubricoccus deserti]
MTIAITSGVMRAGQSIDGVVWNILGQTYRPVQHSEASFAFDTLFPPGTFVPPHVHPTQDEYIRVLEGRFELMLDGKDSFAEAGDLVCMPMGVPHGIFNRSAAPSGRCSGWRRPAASTSCSPGSMACPTRPRWCASPRTTR